MSLPRTLHLPPFVDNRCNGAVNFLLDWDTKAQYRLAALQSKAGSELLQQAGRKPNDLSSVVLVEPGQAYVKSEAVFRIGRRLNTPFFVLGSLGLPIPSLLRDAAYDLVCIALPAHAVEIAMEHTPHNTDSVSNLRVDCNLQACLSLQVANTRYQVFGKTNSCRMCNPAFRERFIDS